ncbi:MAG: acetyl-CoA carboxylase biotin carboxylase subunit, partial [Deltaproteobacteria bacterium]|nr:acetyl-CoA carboxylase biotin carboxylase subunit [Deltaproteobacteria bacterium]
AGTIEFILNEDGKFYFLEVNARLQVEHPITELVTGIDLVKWQILIAGGEPLTLQQKEIKPRGVAIECRICAEDPLHDFVPSPGKITHLQTPGGPSIRVDSALYRGWEVPMYYDALLAKLCAWGKDRKEAISRMQRALREFVLLGVKSNIAFLIKILESPEFQSGRYDTKIVEKVLPAFIDKKEVGDFHILAAMAAAIYAYRTEASILNQATVQRLVQGSPWKEASRSLAVNIRPRLTKRPFLRNNRGKTT